MQIHVGSRKHFLPREILFLESELNYTRIYLKNGSVFLSSTTLTQIERRLCLFQNFIRINRQLIINLDYLKPDQSLNIHVPGNRILRFSRRKKKALSSLLLNRNEFTIS